MVSGPVVLQADGVCFAYPQRVLFAQWSARVAPGVTLVRGDEGSGKTTLLRLLAADLPVQAGQLQIQGVQLDAQSQAYRQRVYRTDPWSDALDQATAREYFASLHARYPQWDAPLLEDLIDALSLTAHQAKPMYMLSTGSKRKVWLAAAFASGAVLTLLDEPFAALDKASIGVVTELLQEAATHSARAWVVADYAAPARVPLAGELVLGSP
ncbi:MAG: ATP-binding cassette domain-containing protein [Rhodoferax sp.]